jgi:propanol-preferring alcohol dehydrogenase
MTMTRLMQAALVRAFGTPLALDEVPRPDPGPGEVLVRVMTSGVCHTDLHAADGDWAAKPALPFIPGHEGAGFVAALGTGTRGLKEGDRVGIAWLHDTCGTCEYCVSGWETLCAAQRTSGYSVNGTFAQYALGTAAFVVPLPGAIAFPDIAPILCAGVTTYKAIRETETRPGEWLAVCGIGGLGHVALQYARAMGLQVVALDVSEEKLALARSLGAEAAIDAGAADAARQVTQLTGGGAHGVLVTAVSPGAFTQALRLVRRRGTVVFVGLPPGNFETRILDVVLKRITIRGSIVGTRRDLTEALQFAAAGKVRAHIRRAPLRDVNQVLADLRAGKVQGRVVLDLPD